MGPRIDIHGLKSGRRLRRLSDEARLYYPLFLGSANGYGRLELEYQSIYREVLSSFRKPLSEEAFWALMQEYRDADLMFVYQAEDQIWAQMDVKKNCLPQHMTQEDKISPPPPEPEYTEWINVVRSASASISTPLKDFPKVFKDFQNTSNNSINVSCEESCVEERREEKNCIEKKEDLPIQTPSHHQPRTVTEQPMRSPGILVMQRRTGVADHHKESFDLFYPIYAAKTGLPLCKADYDESLLAWSRLDFEQQLAAHRDIAEGDYIDGRESQFYFHPARYLNRHIFARKAASKPASKSNSYIRSVRVEDIA